MYGKVASAFFRLSARAELMRARVLFRFASTRASSSRR